MRVLYYYFVSHVNILVSYCIYSSSFKYVIWFDSRSLSRFAFLFYDVPYDGFNLYPRINNLDAIAIVGVISDWFYAQKVTMLDGLFLCCNNL
jgi:hypothetical protein